MELTLLYFDDCPHLVEADRLLCEVQRELGDVVIERRVVDTHERAVAEAFLGSPTILVDGVDPFADGGEPPGLACRIYQTPSGPAGAPTKAQLIEAIGRVRREPR